jgi:hypothetical protein
VRLAAEVHRVVETRDAGLKPLVAALAEFDPAAWFNGCAWKVAQLQSAIPAVPLTRMRDALA